MKKLIALICVCAAMSCAKEQSAPEPTLRVPQRPTVKTQQINVEFGYVDGFYTGYGRTWVLKLTTEPTPAHIKVYYHWTDSLYRSLMTEIHPNTTGMTHYPMYTILTGTYKNFGVDSVVGDKNIAYTVKLKP